MSPAVNCWAIIKSPSGTKTIIDLCVTSAGPWLPAIARFFSLNLDVLTPFAPWANFPIMTAMPKSKILIADDNNTNVELLEAYLDGVECETAVATDGLDTLAKVAEFQPDLILLDIMMPKMSGFEVCKTLKHDAKTRQIMILMVTALNELGDIERAVAAGCDDFLSKPVNKLELVKRVENMLKLRHVTDERDRLRRYIDSMEDRPPPAP
jgi:two-component system, OmpR family, alkaline phosphatase synthesis response regulator PhoP